MDSNGLGMDRREIQAALAKAGELRALHAVLTQGGGGNNNSSPGSLRFLNGASTSMSRASLQFSGQDYPVFTPSYEEEPLPGYHYMHSENQKVLDNWCGLGLQVIEDDEAEFPYNKEQTNFSSTNVARRVFSADDDDHKSSCGNHLMVLQTSPKTNVLKQSMSVASEDFKSITTCNRCKPATISRENDDETKSSKNYIASISTTQQPSMEGQSKNRGPMIFSWLFPRTKKKSKSEMSPNTIESEDASQLFKDAGVFSLETLKRELLEANENRDTALMEVSEMRSSVGEMHKKLANLEAYCEELKRALKLAVQKKDSKKTKSIDGRDDAMPVSRETMVEGFLQVVSEARLSVKQFCKTLVNQVEETDDDELVEKLNLLLEPYDLNLSYKNSRVVLYHMEAIINQLLFEDFENCVFQKKGVPKDLDPQQDRQANFSAFVALRNLSWNEVLRKGTKYYSEDFSRFCDQKMSCIVSVMNWSRPWPEQLLHSFFVSAKCVWLLHLLAFSFNPPLTILRVDEHRSFDPLYMEDINLEKQRRQGPARVKLMVMPGFYVQDKVLKCKVICRYRSM
ncbi:hypothetical protein QJS10_CPA10g00119 [Acorus calamus]|uniref:GIL1/IRKI C-terminal domain-containing protein n=1 Tax=Acorus calamus TaxID=4465 RepID=A0AAV9DY84_ACOCL|nr:hypothetical protein QJS10_CPA10g00119 [Acorus calamus]